MKIRVLFLLLMVTVVSSCHPIYILAPNTSGYIVRIEADGEWEGVVDSQIVSGSFARGIPVYPRYGRTVCWDIRKSRPYPGMLRAFMTYRDYHTGSEMHPRFGDDVTLSVTGRVRGCHAPL